MAAALWTEEAGHNNTAEYEQRLSHECTENSASGVRVSNPVCGKT